MFKEDATDEEIRDTLCKASAEGLDYWLRCYGANLEVFSPDFRKRLEDATETLEELEREIKRRGCVV